VISQTALRNSVNTVFKKKGGGAHRPVKVPARPNPVDGAFLEISGVRHVIRALEDLEMGRLSGIRVLELFSCDQGCFGTPLSLKDAFRSRHRWQTEGVFSEPGGAVRREKPYAPRTGMRLDEDMAGAIAKLSEIDRLTRTLPGRDCGSCGAPTCKALAEDIVLGRATKAACIHFQEQEGESP